MAYDEATAGRVRELLAGAKNVGEIKMFGGLCFTLNGNMVLGVLADELMVRFDPGDTEKILAQRHVREMDFTKRPMKGFAFISRDGFKTAPGLKKWVALSSAYVSGLPPKAPKKKRPVAPKKKRAP